MTNGSNKYVKSTLTYWEFLAKSQSVYIVGEYLRVTLHKS